MPTRPSCPDRAHRGQFALLAVLLGLPAFLAWRWWQYRTGYDLAALAAGTLLWLLAWWRGRGAPALLSAAVSYVFLDVIVRELDPARFAVMLTGTRWQPLVPAMLIMVGALLLQTARWRFLLRGIKFLPFRLVFASQMIGFFGNLILPAKAGELLKVHHLGLRGGISRAPVLATVVLERAFDGLVIVAFLAGSILLFVPGEYDLLPLVAGTVLFYSAAFAGLLVVHRFPAVVTRLALRLCPAGLRAAVADKLAGFLSGLELFRRPRQVAVAFGMSLACWWLIAYSLWPLVQALDPRVAAAAWYAPLLLVAVIAVGQMLPAAPAGLGVLNWACVFALQLLYRRLGLAVDSGQYEQFVLFSLQVQLVMVLPEGLLGFWYFTRERDWLRRPPQPAGAAE